MEKYILNIERSNQYLNNTLSSAAVIDFENDLKTDLDLGVIYDNHLIFLNGLKRNAYKKDIKTAHKAYTRTKWLKYIGVTLGVIITVSSLTYFTLTTLNNSDSIQPKSIHTNIKNELQNEANKEVLITLQNTKGDKENEIRNEEKVGIDTLSRKRTQPKKTTLDTLVNKQDDNAINTILIPTFIKPILKTPQTFIISPDRDTLVIASNGTRLTFKANSFINPDTKKIIKENIKLKVSEYYELDEMILADLTTTSNGELLETGGMLSINALQGDIPVKLSKPMKIEFSKKTHKTGMQLFKGVQNDSHVNWVVNETSQALPIESMAIFASNDAVLKSGVAYDSVYTPIRGLNETIKEILQNDTISISDNFKKEYVGFRKKNWIRDIIINGEKNVILRKPLLEQKKSIFKLQEGDSTTRGGHIIRKPWTPDKISNDTRLQLVPKNANNSFYAFRTLELGLINCDRFVYSKQPKVKFKIKIKDAEGSTIKMVYKSRSSLLSSRSRDDFFNFGEIPKNEEVFLIAIKKVDDLYYLGTKDTTTNLTDDLDMNFTPLNYSELEIELKKLNTLFKN